MPDEAPPSDAPTANTTSTTESEPPISPITRTNTFPHKTSVAVATQTPHIDTGMQAINDAPVEMDGADEASDKVVKTNEGRVISPTLGEDDEISNEFLGEPGARGVGRVVSENRAAVIEGRRKDPGVVVDVPKEPTAEEVEAAKSADGTVTPAMQGKGSS